MNQEGPVLERLIRRLAECPEDFLGEPHLDGRGVVHADALVADLWVMLGADALSVARGEDPPPRLESTDKRYRQLVALACWLLADPWFAGRGAPLSGVARLLLEELPRRARALKPPSCVTDPERREELARLCLRALDLRPAGETPVQAEDRLASLDSLELARVIEETRRQEQHRRKVAEAMRKKAAEEAAAAYGRE